LLLASWGGHASTVRLLLSEGADSRALSHVGYIDRPARLYSAMLRVRNRKGDEEILIQALFVFGLIKVGDSALSLARRRHHEGVLEVLSKLGVTG